MQSKKLKEGKNISASFDKMHYCIPSALIRPSKPPLPDFVGDFYYGTISKGRFVGEMEHRHTQALVLQLIELISLRFLHRHHVIQKIVFGLRR